MATAMRADGCERSARRTDHFASDPAAQPANVPNDHTVGSFRGIHVVSGPAGAGKTTWCTQLVACAQLLGYRAVGLTSPGVYRAGARIGIDLLCLDDGERRALGEPAARQPATVAARVGAEPASKLLVGAWRLNRATLSWGNRELTRLLTNAPRARTILVVDELGPLEFERGQGLTAPLLLPIDEAYHAVFLVVRSRLLAKALERWPRARLVEIGAGAGAGAGR